MLPNSAERDHGRRARRRAVREGRRSSCRRARSRPGLAAAVALDADRGAAENAAAMERRARARCAPAASRPPRARTPQGRFAVGDAVGFVDDELVAWGEPERDAARGARARSATAPSSLTCIAGDGAPLDDDARRGARARRRRARARGRRPAGLVVAAVAPSRPTRPRAVSRRRARLRRARDELDARRAARARPCAGRGPSRARRRRSTRRPPTAAEAAEALGLETVGDLLEHLPRDDRRGAHDRRARSSTRPRRCSSRSARSRSRPVRRRGMKPLVEATVADAHRRDEGDVLQPAVARAPVPARARG